MRSSSLVSIGLVGLSAWSSAWAEEERWLLAVESGAGHAVSRPQSSDFGAGAAGSVGVFRSLTPWVSLGASLRGSIWSVTGLDRSEPEWAPVGTAGLYSLSGTLRLRPFSAEDEASRATGLWIEGSSGGGLTGGLVRPVVGGALGYGVDLGGVVLGPVARYEQVVELQNPLSSDDARLLIGGIQLVFLDSESAPAPRPALRTELAQGPEPQAVTEVFVIPPAEVDVDGDGVLDADDRCPDAPETMNGFNDHDGCPDEEKVEFVNGRLVLEGSILFGFNRAKLKKRARPALDRIAQAFLENDDWVLMRIEGHADVRGDPVYNLQLSEARAEAVARALVRRGVDPAMLKTIGYGEQRPLDPRRTRGAHRRNRRVEFVIVTKSKVVTPPAEVASSAPSAGRVK